MTRQEHWQEAERLLQSVLNKDSPPYSAAAVTLIIATAQVHATLALADDTVAAGDSLVTPR